MKVASRGAVLLLRQALACLVVLTQSCGLCRLTTKEPRARNTPFPEATCHTTRPSNCGSTGLYKCGRCSVLACGHTTPLFCCSAGPASPSALPNAVLPAGALQRLLRGLSMRLQLCSCRKIGNLSVYPGVKETLQSRLRIAVPQSRYCGVCQTAVLQLDAAAPVEGERFQELRLRRSGAKR